MSNLFFKSESVKNSVKSGLNFVSKRVFKVFLLMSMMLLSWNGWGQGYTVIYPEGKTMAEPGDQVTVVFDEDMSNYYYGFTHKNYCEDSTEIGKRTIWAFWEGYRTGEAPSPLDCADNYFSLDKINNISIDESNLSVLKITIPEEHKLSTYDVYFGKKEDVKVYANGWGNCFLTMCSIQDRNKCKKWTKTFTPHGSFRINVVSENLTIRSENCYCPGNVFRFTLENNGYGDNLVWTYDTGTESGEFTPTKVAENVYEQEIPTNFIDGVKIYCRGNVVDPNVAEVNLFVCPPKIVPQRECVDVDKITSVIIENACPSLSYTIVDKKSNTEVWPASTGESNYGGTNYLASFSVGEFEEEVDEEQNVVGHRPKDFGVYANGRLLTSFQVKDCDNWIKSCAEYTPGNFTDCSIAFDGFDSKVSFVPSGGTVTDTIISFYKVDDGDWQSVNNSSRLEPCHTYQIRTNIYIDNINVGYCDSKPFEVKKPGGNQGPQIVDGVYNTEVIAVSNGNCEFSVPDLTDSVKKYVTDECEFVVTQDVSVGEIVAVDSRMQVVATATGKCASKSLTFNVNAPKALVIENVSSEVLCDDQNSLGKISGSINGGVGSFTVTAAKVGGSPIDDSKISLSDRSFTITGLEVGEYKVTVTDANGCFKEETVSVTFTPQELTIIGKNIEKKYNGQPQSAEATAENYQVEGLLQGDEITSITFSQENPLTDVGEISYSIKDVEIKRGEATVTCFYDIAATGATFKVVPRPVTLTSSDSTKVYDGTALTNANVAVDGDGFVEGEATATAIGSQTEVGSSKNTIKVEEGINFKLSNYDITPVEGDLKVTPDIVTVQIKGNKQTFTYNGSEQKVSGYEVVSITSSSLGDKTTFTKDMVEFVPTEDCDGSAVRTDVGKTDMNLSADNFSSLSPNHAVTFEIVEDGLLEITKMAVTVSIAGNTDSKVYNGEAQSVSGYTVVEISAPSLYKESDFTFSGEALAKGTAVGTYPMGLSEGQFTNTNGNFDVTFDVEDGLLEITKPDAVIVTITEHGAVKTYNNEEYVVTGYDFATSNDLYTLSDFKFLGDSVVSGTNVGNYPMGLKAEDFENLNKNFEVEFNVVHNSLVINPLDVLVEITGNSLKVPYDKNEHEVSGYQWSANSNLYTIEDFEFVGDSALAETNVGVYPMGLESGEFTNLDNNFKVTFSVVEDGSLTILAPSKVQVTITEHGSVETYNNEEYVVKGYDFATSNDLYTLSDFKFLGDSVVSGTNVGNYPMGLKAEDFENLNKNFEVEFNVVHNSLVINPLDVLVEITGNSSTEVYNGNQHTLSGYTWRANSNLYTEEDFTFGGDSIATGTIAGKYAMGLLAGEFININKNFNVNFSVVEDGELIISQLDVIVTITGATKETHYTGSSQSISGYTWSSNTSTYTESDFTFSGNSLAYGINVGTYPMNLSADQFTNINKNFGKVTFVIEDGGITITPMVDEVVVRIAGHHEEVLYDGKEHTLTGYSLFTNHNLLTQDDIEFSGEEMAKAVNAGTYHLGLSVDQFKNTNKNFANVKFEVSDGTLIINKRHVLLESESKTQVYNGELFTHKVVNELKDGFAEGEGATYEFYAELLYAGEETNEFSYTLNEGTLAENYIIEEKYGTLTLAPVRKVIDIIANSAEKYHDRKPLSDPGYTYTEGVLIEGDTLIVEIEGVITEVGVTKNEIVSYRVMRGDIDVTDNYTFGTIKNGSLRVLHANHPTVVFVRDGKIIVHEAFEFVYVYDVLSRRVYLDGKAGVFIEEYGELDVPCTGAYVVIIGEESYKVVVHKK